MFVLASRGVSVVEAPQAISYEMLQGASAASLPVLWKEPALPRDLRWVGRLLCLGSACLTVAIFAFVAAQLVV